MNETMVKKETRYLAVMILFILGVVFFGWQNLKPSFASAPSGLPATVGTSTQYTLLAGTAGTLVASSSCTSRVVSTQSSGILLTFDDRYTPTLGVGFWQGASTSVAYDGGLYGCGQMKAISAGAQVITVMDVR